MLNPQKPIKPRILCVDDEQDALEGYKWILRHDFDVVTANSGVEALERLRTDTSIMAIVSDMRMPHMDGATFLSQARIYNERCVRLVLTGHADFDSAMVAVNEGFVFRFLQKPCEPRTLRDSLWHAYIQYQKYASLHEDSLIPPRGQS